MRNKLWTTSHNAPKAFRGNGRPQLVAGVTAVCVFGGGLKLKARDNGSD